MRTCSQIIAHLCFAAMLALAACANHPEGQAADEASTETRTRPACCPRCQSADFVTIAYGLLTAEGERLAREGVIVSGGCLNDREYPDWHCKSCGHDWYDPTDERRKARWDALDREMLEVQEQIERSAKEKEQRRRDSAPGGGK